MCASCRRIQARTALLCEPLDGAGNRISRPVGGTAGDAAPRILGANHARWNPAPEKEVYWSEQSWDEMYNPQIRYTWDRQDLTKPGGTTNRSTQSR
jgi:hypothetical protein